MTDENENRPTRAPLTLKPRPGGSVSTGTVKQSFSHGRSKTVVVETKRPRVGRAGRISPRPRWPRSVRLRRARTAAVGPVRDAGAAPDPHALSADEQQRRQKVATEFAARQQAERAAADARVREAAAARARDEAAKAAAAPPVEAPPSASSSPGRRDARRSAAGAGRGSCRRAGRARADRPC